MFEVEKSDLDTGVKDDQEKPRMELLSNIWLTGVAKVLTYGARKYAADNWRKGLPQRRVLGAALRHITAYMDGEDLDPDTSLNHLFHASCELMFASELFQTRPDLDDRFKVKVPEWKPMIEVFKESPPSSAKDATISKPKEEQADSAPAAKMEKRKDNHPPFQVGDKVAARAEQSLPFFPAEVIRVVKNNSSQWLVEVQDPAGETFITLASLCRLERTK